jgi:hypothetical protein
VAVCSGPFLLSRAQVAAAAAAEKVQAIQRGKLARRQVRHRPSSPTASRCLWLHPAVSVCLCVSCVSVSVCPGVSEGCRGRDRWLRFSPPALRRWRCSGRKWRWTRRRRRRMSVG